MTHHEELVRGFNKRLSLRLDEFCELTGMSKPTLWRRIKSDDIRIVRIGGMPFVTRAELVRLGLIDPDGLTVKK
jgi:hypothetical protein